MVKENEKKVDVECGCDKDECDKCSGEKLDVTTDCESTVASVMEKKLKKTEEEYNSLKDKYLRLSADFENYRRRMDQEKVNAIKYGIEGFVRDVLPVVDDFQRAIRFIDNTDRANNAKDKKKDNDWVRILFSKFINILLKNGVKKIETSINDVFDEKKHDAIQYKATEKKEDDSKIVDIVEEGYTLNGRVIRFVKVIVGHYSK